MNCDFAMIAIGGLIVALGLGIVVELAVIIFRHTDNENDDK